MRQRHAGFHEQAFDLMKHRVVGRIGRVGAIHATQRYDSQGGLAALHHPNLYGACLRAEQKWVGTSRNGQIKIIEGIAGGMLFADSQGVKIVPLVFHFGTIHAFKAQPRHDLLNATDRLGDRMEVTHPNRIAWKRDVNRLYVRHPRLLRGCQAILSQCKAGDNLGFRVIESLTTGRTIVGAQPRKKLLEFLQLAAFHT